MKLLAPSLSLLLFVASVTTAQTESSQKPQASGGGAAVTESTFRVLRSLSGSKLIEQGGRSIVEDVRSLFYTTTDKQVIVYFTWDGPPGQHHFEGLWKNPNGKVVMTSEFDYKPELSRFGAFFKMMLGENPMTGIWTLEARINGENAGSHSFQLSSDPRTDAHATAPARRLMSPSEIYNRAAAASVLIENISNTGERRNVGTGFFIGPAQLLTTFQVIDGATKVRVVGLLSGSVEAVDVLSFNRRQDWIVLKVPTQVSTSLVRAEPNSWAVGDRNYFLDAPSEGSRVLVETSIIGKQNLINVGERLNIAATANRRALGSPLLNEFGEVVGILGGSLIPGTPFFDDFPFGAPNISLGATTRGMFSVPITMVDTSIGNQTNIDGLAKSGQFLPPLLAQNVLSGVLGRSVNKKSDPPQVIDEKVEFSRTATNAVLLITWLPKEKRKGQPALRVYDFDNRLLTETVNKKKITITPSKLSYSLWDLNLSALAAGIYRVDVLLGSDVVWREFFRMLD